MKRLKTWQKKKLLVLMMIVVFSMIGLTGRLTYLMIIRSEFYGKKAEDLHERERSIKAARGRSWIATESFWQQINLSVRCP